MQLLCRFMQRAVLEFESGSGVTINDPTMIILSAPLSFCFAFYLWGGGVNGLLHPPPPKETA